MENPLPQIEWKHARPKARAALALVGAALLGALAGAFVAVVIVDYTDANASHTAIDLAVVAVCALAGVALALRLRGHRAGAPAGRDRAGGPGTPSR